jgi:hypothetical protein
MSIWQLNAQSDYQFEKIKDADSLGISIHYKRFSKKSHCRAKLEGKLRYDFINQYPYYELPFPQLTGDTLEFELERFPAAGHLYVYSISPMNTALMHKYIALDVYGLQTHVPYPLLEFTEPGIYHFCFLYSRTPLEQPERLVMAMEMTQGTFLFRQQAMLENILLLPQRKWQLLGAGFGATFDPALFKQKENGGILVYLEVQVQTKR